VINSLGKSPRIACWLVLITGMVGCQEEPKGYERFVPPAEDARGAVVAMLTSWRDSVALPEGSNIRITDIHRKLGQELHAFDVMGEVPVENVRAFAVRLHLKNPDETQVVRYFVLGTDPLWVLRQEDYDMIAHWQCAPKKTEEPADVPSLISSVAEEPKETPSLLSSGEDHTVNPPPPGED